jgi:hypothetical protein
MMINLWNDHRLATYFARVEIVYIQKSRVCTTKVVNTVTYKL